MPPPDSPPPQLDLESIFKDVLTRADVSEDVQATILAVARKWDRILEGRVQRVQTTRDWTRIMVTSQYSYQGKTQYADFWFPPNPKHFEEELKRVQITGQTVEVQFYRAHRDEDHEITSLEVTDYNIKIIGS